jgi:hypothetical protein
VGGRNVELPAILVRELLAELLDVLRIEQNALDDAHELTSRLSQAEEALAATNEKLDAQLVLEILDVLRDAGLRGVERVGDIGEIEVAFDRFTDDAKLLKVHFGTCDAMWQRPRPPQTGWSAKRAKRHEDC